MKFDDFGCSSLPAFERCAVDLPDNPQCAPNYHFGMLLGVDDFRCEQGFHLGRLRRHQRLLHGAGVVAGYPVAFRDDALELRVGPGHAIDALGRDLVLDVTQCVSLPLWWLEHRGDEAFSDIATPDDALIDLDLMVCHAGCLGSPVPAVAEPCAGDAADVAYSRICETVDLVLMRSPEPTAAPATGPFHLLQMWFGLVGPRLGAELTALAGDQWLIDRYHALQQLTQQQQVAARSTLLRELLARAVAERQPALPAASVEQAPPCLALARLRDVHLKLEPAGWRVEIGAIELGLRDALLPAGLLQSLLIGEPLGEPAPAGPIIVGSGATLDGAALQLVFSQPLAPASVDAAAFLVSEFDAATGWQPFMPEPPSYDDTDPSRPTVRMQLDREPTGALLRITVIGTGSEPLLGARLVAAGALHPLGNGRDLTTSIHRG